ncbi:acetate--CoA ligase [Suttonella sp. R2A3]|uniref:acetate--CoA ligase n=1 Tax=Suttonella sp. R2A3 TaxID=2908648 RepID=UPI001F4231C6|nr:acetate--CoA ligase [Suttonella sp. R2A3]UJF24591.1 acetate--CoA ligase [Suttonella sp. R2A3]
MADLKQCYDVPEAAAEHAHIDAASYDKLYAYSIENPDAFWAEQAEKRLSWYKKWDSVHNSDLNVGRIRWFEGAELNVAYNCIDRHLDERGKQTAFIFEHNQPGKSYRVSYRELHTQVCKFANVLKSMGVKKGDRVCIYLPMIEEAAVAMLGCARIGAVHSVVFGGFSPDALASRIDDAQAKVVVTSDAGYRGDKFTHVKRSVDQALRKTDIVEHVIVVQVNKEEIYWQQGRDVWYHDVMRDASADCPCEPMDAEDPLFILYTSGSTGTPKGVLHTTGGYLLYAATTFDYTFDYHDGEVYWCTADVGWITGHSYCVYGPLANGATSLIFGGVPNYPDPSRFWQVVDEHRVNLFYTAPTAIRALMREGNDFVEKTDRSSLRVLGTVGEPINPEAWHWYYEVVGDARCQIVDTWWQTENGGHMITPLPGATPLKPGSAGKPFFGVQPAIFDQEGNELEGKAEGVLVIKQDWPGMMRTVWGDHERFMQTYLSTYPGTYFTGDGARRDEDGYYWITGRVDDVLNVSGHRLGTAEIESALVLHNAVAEAAIVGYPHDIKGQGIYAYVTLMNDAEPSDALKNELVKFVRKEMGPIVSLDVVQWAPSLPKTRSGKIMRRILRKIAANEIDSLGDTSTLAEPQVVEDLIENRANR